MWWAIIVDSSCNQKKQVLFSWISSRCKTGVSEIVATLQSVLAFVPCRKVIFFDRMRRRLHDDIVLKTERQGEDFRFGNNIMQLINFSQTPIASLVWTSCVKICLIRKLFFSPVFCVSFICILYCRFLVGYYVFSKQKCSEN